MKSSIACLAAALLAGTALAQEQPRSSTPPPSAHTQTQEAPSAAQPTSADIGAIFDKLNTSHSGKMTKAEAQAHPTVAANFDAVDTNHDGVITKDEFLAAFTPRQ
jgi:EF hand